MCSNYITLSAYSYCKNEQNGRKLQSLSDVYINTSPPPAYVSANSVTSCQPCPLNSRPLYRTFRLKLYNRMRFYFLFCLLFLFNSLSAQVRYTVSGYVRDSANGEDLIGAAVLVKETGAGTVTNTYGRYALNLPGGTYTLRVASVGYKTIEQRITLSADKQVDFIIAPETAEQKEIVLKADAPRAELDRTQMGKVNLQMSKVRELPVLFGEVDVLKTLQLLPGVQSSSEGTTGFYVRGGGPDQNLIILDEAVVYNASHLFGFFSVFNADAIKNVELYKGGYPSKFGGRLSSVVEVNLKDGNKKEYDVSGGLGLIASRLTVEGPIIKDKSSFVVSGRRTYFDIFTRAYNKTQEDNPGFNPIPDYYFYDLNAKINYELGGRDRLFLSGYFGRDIFGFSRDDFDFSFNWGNATTTARWNHVFTPRLFMNTSATFTDYRYTLNQEVDVFKAEVSSHIRDISLKADLDFAANPRHYIRFGGGGIYHTFGVGRLSFTSSDNSFNLKQDNTQYGSEIYAYVSDDWQLDSSWKVNLGMRLSGFAAKEKFYYGAEPRLSLLYKLSRYVSLKGSFTQMNQYVHLVTNTGATLPTDVWYPSNKAVKPQLARQVAAGITATLFGDKVLLTNEVYYKWLNNQIDFRDGAQLFFNNNLDSEFVFGRGWSYGNEILLEMREGRLTGWIGYTLSWTYRQFDEINNGEKFFPKYDQRNNVSIVLSYPLNKRFTLSGTWVYGDGNAYSLPVGWSFFNDIPGSHSFIIPYYEKRNALRMPAYHRMDAALVWKFFPKWGSSDLTFSVYNVYNRRNAYIVYIAQSINDDPGTLRIPVGATARQISLFPIIPSVTFNFKF